MNSRIFSRARSDSDELDKAFRTSFCACEIDPPDGRSKVNEAPANITYLPASSWYLRARQVVMKLLGNRNRTVGLMIYAYVHNR